MSVNPSSTYEFTINQIVRLAFVKASQMAIEEPAAGVQWDQRVQYGYQTLELLMKELEADGKISRARRLTTIQLVAGQNVYTLDESIMDVLEDAAFIPPGQVADTVGGSTPVKPMDMEAWNRLTSKAASGRPNLYFCYRGVAPLQLKIWPTPSVQDNGQLQLQVMNFLGQNTDGTRNPDLERYWGNFLVHALAAEIAEAAGQGADKVMRLEAKAADKFTRAKSYSRQRTPAQVVVTHRSGYGGYRR